MRKLPRFLAGPLGSNAASISFLVTLAALLGQMSECDAADAGTTFKPLNWTTQQDHKNMMQQLGITRLRPGPSGQPGATNSANYDPAQANPFPDLADVLTLKNGQKVTASGMWWKQRRQ
jgi:hypothetical protein